MDEKFILRKSFNGKSFTLKVKSENEYCPTVSMAIEYTGEMRFLSNETSLGSKDYVSNIMVKDGAETANNFVISSSKRRMLLMATKWSQYFIIDNGCCFFWKGQSGRKNS